MILRFAEVVGLIVQEVSMQNIQRGSIKNKRFWRNYDIYCTSGDKSSVYFPSSDLQDVNSSDDDEPGPVGACIVMKSSCSCCS